MQKYFTKEPDLRNASILLQFTIFENAYLNHHYCSYCSWSAVMAD